LLIRGTGREWFTFSLDHAGTGREWNGMGRDWFSFLFPCPSLPSTPCFTAELNGPCVLRRIHTMRRLFGDRSAGGSVPSPSQLDRARTRFSTKIGSITINYNKPIGPLPAAFCLASSIAFCCSFCFFLNSASCYSLHINNTDMLVVIISSDPRNTKFIIIQLHQFTV